MAQGILAEDRLQTVTGGFRTFRGERLMAKTNQRTARKPATKYPNLQKKLQKRKVKAGAAKKK